MDPGAISKVAIGAACVVLDKEGRVLLVHHTYGARNWELPGGLGEANETPEETALRELREETGMTTASERLTGLYFEPGHEFGPMLHFVFRCRGAAGFAPVPDGVEISEAAYWPLAALPPAMSAFARRRLTDALGDGPAVVARRGVEP